MLGDNLVKVGDMPEYRQALLCVGTALLSRIIDQHATQHPFTEPGVVADLLVQEVGKVTRPDNKRVVQAGVGGKAFLQFTHHHM
ncbi:hypothetical protein D3C80_1816420 [compost metagenome]